MTLGARSYATCFGLATAFFVFSTLVSDVAARMTIQREGLGHALSEHAYYAAAQPIGTLMLLLPFLLVAWMGASLAQRKSMSAGVTLVVSTCSVLAAMCFDGFQDSQAYLAQESWTASALSVGLLPFQSIPVVAVALVAFLILRRVAG